MSFLQLLARERVLLPLGDSRGRAMQVSCPPRPEPAFGDGEILRDHRIGDTPLVRSWSTRRPTHRGVSWRLKRMFDVVSAGSALLVSRAYDLVDAQGRVEYEGWRLRKDGSRFWASVAVSAAPFSSMSRTSHSISAISRR